MYIAALETVVFIHCNYLSSCQSTDVTESVYVHALDGTTTGEQGRTRENVRHKNVCSYARIHVSVTYSTCISQCGNPIVTRLGYSFRDSRNSLSVLTHVNCSEH